MTDVYLVRYGAIPEVARFKSEAAAPVGRESRVVVRSHRGTEVGTVLERVIPDDEPESNGNGSATAETDFTILRPATSDDLTRAEQHRTECEGEFGTWRRRIDNWNLDLELIDLERTLDREKLILYVLNDRGPDCTKLALQAAAAGLGTIEVQPVNAEGLVRLETAGGCGSGGCGSGGCGS